MADMIQNIPLLTASVLGFCVSLFVAQSWLPSVRAVCLSPVAAITSFEIYRFVTAPFFHAGFFHIGFNMLAWFFLGRDFERLVGTLAASYTVFLLIIPFMSLIYCVVPFVIDAVAGTNFRYECAVGFSGVLFSLLVINVHTSMAEFISVCGLFDMPSRWYPWFLAAVLQLLSPNLSLMGHVAGILVGNAVVYGMLRPLTPSDAKLTNIEDRLQLYSLPLWVAVPASTSLSGYGGGLGGGLPVTDSGSTGSSWQESVSTWFSSFRASLPAWMPGSTRQEVEIFEGQGHALGGQSGSSAHGRVPPGSRLLEEAREATAERPLARDVTADEPEAGDAKPSEAGRSVTDAASVDKNGTT